MRVLTIFGTRPEAIKLAPVLRELRHRPEGIVSLVCVTGQHRQMLDQALRLFGIRTDYDLDVMAENQSPAGVASATLERLEPILRAEKPEWVIVQGDTTTTAAASLAAYYTRSRVAHVEAGLRTDDKWQPFPEEINRRVASAIADFHFAPTERARVNLLREGIPPDNVLVTGNPVIDALHWVAQMPANGSTSSLFEEIGIRNSKGVENERTSGCQKIVLVTAHRRETFGQPLEDICCALRELAAKYEKLLRIVFPVHMNPNVFRPVHRLLEGIDNIVLTPPLDYLTLVHLLKECFIVLTDSGGIQEEAPSLGVPVLVLRDKTERPEAVDAGTAQVVGTERHRIVRAVERLFADGEEYRRMAHAINPYGDGKAAARICNALLEHDHR